MSMIDSQSKKMLVEAMRRDLAKAVLENKELTESAQVEGMNFVAEQATYEQLLNLAMNPLRESKYLPAYVLEGAVAVVSSAMMTGRKVIGVNAITEGAIRLEKMTGAVVTESMLDAALEIAKGKGIYTVAECLKESFALQAAAEAEANKPTLSAKAKALKESVVTEAEGKENIVKRAAKATWSGVKKAVGVNNLKKAAELKKAGEDAAKKAINTKAAQNVAKAAGKKAAEGKTGDAAKKAIKKAVRKSLKDTAKKAASEGSKGRGKELLKAGGKIGAVTAGAVGLGYAAKKWHDKKKSAK